MSEQEQTPREILQTWIGMGEYPTREEMSLVTLAKVREAIRALLVSEHQARDVAAGAQTRVADLEAERDALRLDLAEACRGAAALARERNGAQGEWDALRAEVTEARRAQYQVLWKALEDAGITRGDGCPDSILIEEVTKLRAEVERLRAAGEGHPGFCCGACSGRYADEKARAERAEAALREISVADGANHAGVLALAALRDTAPAEPRHWQNDADPNPGREQTAYQAEREREKP